MGDRILVIDDDQSLRLLYKSELEQQGYQVDTVGSGDEALEIVGKTRYDVAVVDIEMPGISGLELLSRLRELTPQTALLLNSAYSNYKDDFNSWVADGYLVKSSDLTQLKETVKELMVPSDA